ncbi:hypothetical protein RB195_016721 [Necator americanus]|uniref:Uncharacterized protein n=1 Tax=Necator americanus TaxID=51031 RepID=A0ABR1C1T2_NECAM
MISMLSRRCLCRAAVVHVKPLPVAVSSYSTSFHGSHGSHGQLSMSSKPGNLKPSIVVYVGAIRQDLCLRTYTCTVLYGSLSMAERHEILFLAAELEGLLSLIE